MIGIINHLEDPLQGHLADHRPSIGAPAAMRLWRKPGARERGHLPRCRERIRRSPTRTSRRRIVHPVTIWDTDGNFISSWGEGEFRGPHGTHVAPDDHVWLTDMYEHVVQGGLGPPPGPGLGRRPPPPCPCRYPCRADRIGCSYRSQAGEGGAVGNGRGAHLGTEPCYPVLISWPSLDAPGAARLARLPAELSMEAKRRWKVVRWCEEHEGKVRLTARHFGYSPDTISRWVRSYLRSQRGADVRRRSGVLSCLSGR